ncbi:MAG: hypothetical protein LBQ61_02380 [Spirochaetales bacterium]|nr:hypothetical protein [Spirochaetales bacterium]
MTIAYNAHNGQLDNGKEGQPYIFHPIHLAEQMTDEISCCAALLHDVVEDTHLTFEDLGQQGISQEVIDCLKLLTHKKEVPYFDYVNEIKNSGNETAIKVKLADLRHNSDLTRLKTVTPYALQRREKYQQAIKLLEEGALV